MREEGEDTFTKSFETKEGQRRRLSTAAAQGRARTLIGKKERRERRKGVMAVETVFKERC
jgi:hypothetical protein